MKIVKICFFLIFCFYQTYVYGIQAGFSEVDITPSEDNIILGGYGTYFGSKKQTRRSEGIHDRLYATTVVLGRDASASNFIALTTLDAIGLSPRIVEKVKKKLAKMLMGTFYERKVKIILTASHSHATPDIVGLWGNLPFSGIDDDYLDSIEEKIAGSIFKAINNMNFVQVNKTVSDVATRSPIPNLTSKLYNIWFSDVYGKIVGSLSQWNAHPTILDGKNNYISAGYVGAFRHHMKRSFGGFHMFLNGMLGNVYAAYIEEADKDPFDGANKSIYDPDVPVEKYLQMVGLGEKLAKVSAASLAAYVQKPSKIDSNRPNDNITLKTFYFKTRNKNALFKSALKLRVIERRREGHFFIKSELSYLKIGSIDLIFVPGEITPTATIKVAEALGLEEGFLIIGIANDWLGYILTKEQYEQESYKYFKLLSISDKIVDKMICSINNCTQGF